MEIAQQNTKSEQIMNSLRILQATRENIDALKWSFLSTAIWMSLAHLCRWMNITMASHDAIMIVQDDAMWEVTLGRFLQPVFVALRGDIASPFLLGILSTVFLALTVFISSKMLGFTTPPKITLLSGMLATCFTITLHNASFIFSIDLSMAACFLGALASFLTARYKYGFIPGILCFFSIFALSPGYITYPITLTLLFLLKLCLQGVSIKRITIIGLKALVFILVGALLYLTIYPLILSIFDTSASTYKGFSNIADFSNVSFMNLFITAYSLPFTVMANPPMFGGEVVGAINVMLGVLILILFTLCCIDRKTPVKSISLALLILLLLPLGANCSYLVAREASHELFYFSFNLFYALVLLLYSLVFSKKNRHKLRILCSARLVEVIKMAIFCSFSIILVANIIYANQVYVRKDLEGQATLSVMTRIVDDIEEIDSYEVGITPVAIVGDFRLNEPYFRPMYGFEDMQGNGVYNGSFALTHDGTYWRYIKTFMNNPMNLVPQSEINKLAETEPVKSLPSYPHKGYCSLVNGVVVVKLSPV